MKKILYLFLVLPLLFSSCAKEEGCTDPLASNYNADAEDNDGSCLYSVIATWNLNSYTVDGINVMSSLLDPYIVSGTWTVSANGTYSTNIVYSDASVLLGAGTWALIGTSIFAITDVDGTENWTITQLDGNTMELSATIDGSPAVISLAK
tara:strand:+ start:22 stop:471 length:450 start_codon:yes stop_codon:yes gene_type:complete